MPKTKPLSFNLCDYQDLRLTFVNGKGQVIYSLNYTRAKLRKGALESPRAVESIHFSAYERSDNFTSRVELQRAARLFASTGKRLKLERRLRVTRKTGIKAELYGAAGLLLAHATIGGDGESYFVANGETGGMHGLTVFGPDPEQIPPRQGRR
jgi:hypothetical protein